MLLNKDNIPSQYIIQRYVPGEITINHRVMHTSVIISKDQLLPWPPQTVADLTPSSWEPIFAFKPEILIIGVGAKPCMLSPEILKPLYAQRIGFEMMATPDACRTFMVLMAESRHAVAALIVDKRRPEDEKNTT